MLKRYVFLFITIIMFVTACAARRENMVVTPVPTPLAATHVPTVLPSVPPTAERSVPKQNDLIFIEFFAVT